MAHKITNEEDPEIVDMDDFAEPEVGVAVAITAAICSPKVRRTLRKGLIYGLAGLISVGDAAQEAAQGVKSAVKSRKPVAAEQQPEPAGDE